ncbi:hypothetical protein ACHAXM_010564 [Skeletonema potamos]
MESFQPLLGGAGNVHPNNENRVNYGNDAPSYGSLKHQSKINNTRDVTQFPFVPMGRLPPTHLRQRANSSDDRSASEISTLSGRSGLSNNQRVRSSSPVPGINGNYGAPPLASRKAPPLTGLDGSGRSISSSGGGNQNNVFRPHPLLKSSSNASSSSYRHRSNSTDGGFRPPIIRQSSSGSVFSISSQESGGCMSPEAVKLLPDPRWGGGGGANRVRSFSSGSHMRRNTFSNFSGVISGGSDFDYGSLQGLTIGNNMDLAPNTAGGKKKHHRRNSSVGSYVSVVSTDQSIDPVTTNMSKSSMLKEITNKGVVRMQLPKDQFRLLSDRDLEVGTVYKRLLVDNEDDYYLDYHMTSVEDYPAAHNAECQCICDSCTRCHTRTKQLPPTYYVMAVKSDIFRRMFDEVSASKSMPCGLFFCGHHEDVRFPSVTIAVVIVSILFVALFLATIFVNG